MKKLYTLLLVIPFLMNCTKEDHSLSIVGDWVDQEDGYIMSINPNGTLLLEGSLSRWEYELESSTLEISWPGQNYRFKYSVGILNEEVLDIKLMEHNTDYPVRYEHQLFKRLH